MASSYDDASAMWYGIVMLWSSGLQSRGFESYRRLLENTQEQQVLEKVLENPGIID